MKYHCKYRLCAGCVATQLAVTGVPLSPFDIASLYTIRKDGWREPLFLTSFLNTITLYVYLDISALKGAILFVICVLHAICLLGEDTDQELALLVRLECGRHDEIMAGRQLEAAAHLHNEETNK